LMTISTIFFIMFASFIAITVRTYYFIAPTDIFQMFYAI
jgi:hypothetical protein